MLINVFSGNAFSMANLTTAIDVLPYVPAQLGASKLFTEIPVSTLTVMIEENHGVLTLIQSKARGETSNPSAPRTRKVRAFVVPHLPQDDSILADDVANIRAFGSETELELAQDLVNDKLEAMKQNHEATWERHRLGAVLGQIIDADNAVIYNLFTEFGVTQTEVQIVPATLNDVRSKSLTIKRSIEDALGGTPYTAIQVLCSSTFFSALITSVDVKAAYDRWQDGQFHRNDPRFTGFEFPTGVFWSEYRGGHITAGDAVAYPTGVPSLFERYNAPANFMETVGTRGKPMYAKTAMRKFETGVDLHTQSNPLHMCTRPKTLIRVHL